jgi:hypothetical protein
MIMAGRMLTARRSLRDTPWNGAFLDHFMQMLYRLDARQHGFGAADIASIEAAWDSPDGDAWSGGMITRLNDGRRGYVEGTSDFAQWGPDARMDARLMAPATTMPRDPDENHCWNDHLGRCLNEFFSTMATR